MTSMASGIPMVATDTTISGCAGRISSASSRPAGLRERHAQVDPDQQGDRQVVGERARAGARPPGSPRQSCRYDRRPWTSTLPPSICPPRSSRSIEALVPRRCSPSRWPRRATGLAEGGIPIGAALFHARRDPPRAGPQPPGPGRRPLGARRDRRLPQRRPAARLRRLRHGDDALAVLVLQRARSASSASAPWSSARHGTSRAATGGWPSTAVGWSLLDDPECIDLLGDFIAAHPELWHEDIGL